MESITEKDIFLSDLNNGKAKETHLSAEKSKRSKLWRTFINIKTFAIIAGVANIPVYSASLLLSSQLTSIEKHFGISSSKSAGLISANEIGFLITVLPFGYVFKDSNKPFILAIANIGSAIACFVCTLPYFFLQVPETNQNWNATSASSLAPLLPCMNINASGHANSTCTTEKGETRSATAAYALIFIGMILGGICKAVRSPLIACYIDDNINKAYIGGYMSECLSL
ncbi:solute carrier organic anion transporter family member 2A1 [Octopus bimaculoides]|uniref:solute carrier organic anion transporter family member 2A1 n=1 Tax=Octopus bimaculoides TaxID=37653 RepID=UPI00071DBCFD|nr:solute carrier organic anion transporter family member 2A1 [Octopus bimaculoides]|eukprot:XP_014773536.1 PREDICTED: solute carrier organic anion transporter family member 2A1-like [Octopus bimaculoides]